MIGLSVRNARAEMKKLRQFTTSEVTRAKTMSPDSYLDSMDNYDLITVAHIYFQAYGKYWV